MGDMPIGAPKLPSFSPGNIIQKVADAVELNELKLYLILGILFLGVGVILYYIWEEYKKYPIKHKSARWGKGMKLSDMLRKR